MNLRCETVATTALGSPLRRSGTEIFFRCPNHEDEHPSLQVNTNKNVFLCGPCNQSGNAWRLAAFLARVEPTDKKAVTAWLRDRGLLDASNGYRSAGGFQRVEEFRYSQNLRKVRLERPASNGSKPEKTFRWEHRQGDLWLPGAGNFLKPLYTNARFRESDQLGLVVGFEGEGKADLAGELGFAAFSFKNLIASHCDILAGLDVVVWPDADASGFKQCTEAAKVMHKSQQPRLIRMIVPPPELPVAGDIADAVRSLGWGRAEIEKLIRTASEWKPQAVPSTALASGLIGRIPITETSNAERFFKKYRDEVRFCSDRNVWCVWNGNHWVVNDIGGVMRRMQEISRAVYLEAANEPGESLRKALGTWAKESESRRTQENSAAIARWFNGIEIRKFSEVFDTHPMLLNVTNGTIDLKTGELRPHRREDFLTKMVPIEFDAKAVCPRFSRFLNETLPAAGLVGYLSRFAGYCLTGQTTEQAWFMFYGVTASGKSTLLTVLRGLLGPYALALPENYFLVTKNTSDFATANLAGVRLATCVETNEGKRLDVAKIKSLTGEDVISAALKYENYFEFKPQAKLVLATNHRPHVPDTDDSIWRRLKVVPFIITVPEDKRIPGLAEQLLEQEWPGILRWAVLGCQGWLMCRLAEPEAVRSAVNEYRTEEDIVQQFLDECCVKLASAKLARKTLFAAYMQWSKDNGLYSMTNNKFSRELHRLGVAQDEGRRFWYGIGFRDDSDA
jgi:P4 family phage/plasmid primase-like protien